MQPILFFAVALVISSTPRSAFGQTVITSEIAPTGKLRVAMNAGTPVLLMRTADEKITGGVGLEVGKFIADRLGVQFELLPYPDASRYTQSFGKGEWDIGLGARTSLVAEKADFIADLLLNDYWYVAAPGHEFADAAQVDRPGVKIGVGQDSTADQFLSRTLKSAELVRRSGADQSIEAMHSGQVHVWAASASNIEQLAARIPGAKIVPGTFMSDRSMVILPKGRSSAAQAKIAEIVNEAKKMGVVRKALEQTGVKGVRAAP
jgi:polar amino acid transport system substrate-binding protein